MQCNPAAKRITEKRKSDDVPLRHAGGDERRAKKAAEAENWTRCMFFMTKKRRYCNMARFPGSQYCGVHRYEATDDKAASNPSVRAETRGPRVPCPIDPSHTVFERDLKRHTAKCNKKKARLEMEALPFFVSGVNSGRTPDISPTTPAAGDDVRRIDARLQAIDFGSFRSRLCSTFDARVGSIASEFYQHASMRHLLQFADEKCVHANRRHLEQQASIIGCMDKRDLLQPSAAYVELGAGRGMLAATVHEAVPSAHILVNDISGVRNKADRVLRKDATKFARIRMDLQHLHLGRFPDIGDRPLITIAKHLCGGATDFALRCTLKTAPGAEDTRSPTSAEDQEVYVWPQSVHGVCIATCCHHLCTWSAYIGRHWWLNEAGLTPDDFETAKCLSSWAVSGPDSSRKPVGEQRPVSMDSASADGSATANAPESGRGASDAGAAAAIEQTGGAAGIADGVTPTVGGHDGREISDAARDAEIARRLEVMQRENSTFLADLRTEWDITDPRSLSMQAKIALGRACKRLIDQGRVAFLAACQSAAADGRTGTAELVSYCDTVLSPENALILASFR